VKLLTTTNRYYFALVAVLFVVGGAGLYYGTQWALAHEVDEQLLFHRDYLTRDIQRTGLLPVITNPHELSIGDQPQVAGLGDTLLYDPVERTHVPFRTVSFAVDVDGRRHWLTLRKSLIETREALGVTVGLMLGMMSVLLMSVVLLNRWLSRWLWAPFRSTLVALRGYQLQQPQSLLLPATAIDEFSELNQAVNQLTERVAADFRALKEFTENAAHETQTPLAIMQAKLEQIMQLDELPTAAVPPLQDLYQATLRLSRLHHALTLLSKIENRQFADAVPVQLNELVADKLAQLQDFSEAKRLKVTLSVQAPLTLRMHPLLADSLVNNLLQNAIKHNYPGGHLWIQLDAAGLEITNSGPALTVDPAQLLGRFRKHNAASDSPGLGLSIVQQICTLYGFRLSYTFAGKEALHMLRVQV
jgi:signal transduction histidine kinase